VSIFAQQQPRRCVSRPAACVLLAGRTASGPALGEALARVPREK